MEHLLRRLLFYPILPGILIAHFILSSAKAPVHGLEHYPFQYSYISGASETSGGFIAVDAVLTKGAFSDTDSQLLSEKPAVRVQWLVSCARTIILYLTLN